MARWFCITAVMASQVASAQVVISARATLAADAGPSMRLVIDGIPVAVAEVRSTSLTSYTFPVVASATSRLDVVFTNDAVINGQDRNLIVDSVTVSGRRLSLAHSFYDRGAGVDAFDGYDVLAGQSALWWSGALRFAQVVDGGIADFDVDGVPDAFDNCRTVANPLQQDTNGNGIGNLCDADLNGDGVVNVLDQTRFMQVLGKPHIDEPHSAVYDLNEDGYVDTGDMRVLEQVDAGFRDGRFRGDLDGDRVIDGLDKKTMASVLGKHTKPNSPMVQAADIHIYWLSNGIIEADDLADFPKAFFDYHDVSALDFNHDGWVTYADVMVFPYSTMFGSDAGFDATYDVNHDGAVDAHDYEIVRSAASGGHPFRGDVNNDLICDSRDLELATALLGQSFTSEDFVLLRADLDGDGVITSSDAAIQNALYPWPGRTNLVRDSLFADQLDMERLKTKYGQGRLPRLADFNSDGAVNAADLARFSKMYGKAPPLTASTSATLAAWQLGLIINDDDPYSVSIGEYYRVKRNIPLSNIVHVRLPTSVSLTFAQFAPTKQRIDAQLPVWVQAIAAAWVAPYRIGCESVTHVLSTAAGTAQTCPAGSTNPLYAGAGANDDAWYGDTAYSFLRDRQRPSMLLAARTVSEAKNLIDRGLASDRTRPTGKGYMMVTSDSLRRLRATMFDTRYAGTYISSSVDLQRWSGNSISNTTDTLFYFQGLSKVPTTSNQFPPGAFIDNLTSYGGMLLENTGQTSILDFISAGATGSFGTVLEPYALVAKFPDPRLMVQQYTKGQTLLQAAWSSVSWTNEGLFIGDPLAAPWRQ